MMSIGPTTRHSLLKGMRGGKDEAAWRRFCHAYTPMLLMIGRRYNLSDADADEIISETICAVHRHFSDFDDPFDKAKGSFRGWLGILVKNKVIDAWRKKNRYATVQIHENQPDTKMAEDFEKLYEREWRINLLSRAMEEAKTCLVPTVYQAFVLYAIQGQRPDDVARLLSIAPGTVFVYKRRALIMIRRIVNRLMKEEG